MLKHNSYFEGKVQSAGYDAVPGVVRLGEGA